MVTSFFFGQDLLHQFREDHELHDSLIVDGLEKIKTTWSLIWMQVEEIREGYHISFQSLWYQLLFQLMFQYQIYLIMDL